MEGKYKSMIISKGDTVASIVTRNLQSAAVFNSYEIDFCCRGGRTLEDACIEGNVSLGEILDVLWGLDTKNNPVPDFGIMRIDMLAEYIKRIHHSYTERKLIFIKNNLDRLVRDHQSSNPELPQIQKVFEDLSMDLRIHMKQEEFMIFPYIKTMIKKRSIRSKLFKTIQDPIIAMKDDHDNEEKGFDVLSDLTHNYSIPNRGYYAFKATYAAMKDLEEDLKIHMHLENNILFPKAINLEVELKHNSN
jgi:regulator of cell morphogenesis and NO signaling